jgi:hypothetical protein
MASSAGSEPERPALPWGRLLVTIAVVVLALSVAGWIVRTVWGLLKVAAVVIVAVAAINWAINKRADRVD